MEIVLHGETKSTAALLGRFLFAVIIAACIVGSAAGQFNADGANSPPTMLILLLGFVLYSAAVGVWREWRYPPYVEIKNRRLTVQMGRAPFTTDVMNILQVFMVGGHFCIGFRDLRVIESSNSDATRKWLAQQQQATGCHFVTPRGVFSLEQMNALRHALGESAQESDDRDRRLSDFETALKQVTPTTWATAAIFNINILVFVLLSIADARKTGNVMRIFSNISPELILDWGGNFPSLTANGELWRLMTCLFLHWTLIHLTFNMWILNDIGRLVERMFGSIPYLVVYMFAGVCGSLATVYWSSFGRSVLSAGASGAIFGMFGLMLGMLWQRHRDFPADLLRAHKASCLSFVVFNLVFGLTMPNVDLAAHVGGLIGGLLCGLVAKPILPPYGIPTLFARLRTLIPVCVMVTAAGIGFLPQPGTDFTWELSKFLTMEQTSIARYNEITTKADQKTPPDKTAELLQRDVVAPWRQELERMSSLTRIKPSDRAAWEAVRSYITLRAESFDLISQAIAEQNLLKQKEAIDKLSTARGILEDWVKKDGQRYGISLPKDSTKPH